MLKHTKTKPLNSIKLMNISSLWVEKNKQWGNRKPFSTISTLLAPNIFFNIKYALTLIITIMIIRYDIHLFTYTVNDSLILLFFFSKYIFVKKGKSRENAILSSVAPSFLTSFEIRFRVSHLKLNLFLNPTQFTMYTLM